MEVVVTSIQDGFPKWVKRHLTCHEMLVLLVCVISFLFGLPNISQVKYFFNKMDFILQFKLKLKFKLNS